MVNGASDRDPAACRDAAGSGPDTAAAAATAAAPAPARSPTEAATLAETAPLTSNPPPGLGHVLATCVRNEGPYMVEFVAHHRVLGFDGIYIASNDCTDGTDRLLARLGAGGAIGHLDHSVPEGRGAQRLGFARLRAAFGLQRAAWVMMLDADEFLIVNEGGGRVADLTASVAPDIDIVALASKTFGSAPLPPDWAFRRVCRRLRVRVLDRNRVNGSIKTLTRDPGRFGAMDHHCVLEFQGDRPVKVLRSNGTTFEIPPGESLYPHLHHHKRGNVGHEAGYYNHYSVKSPEEFLLRQKRGRGVPSAHMRHSEAYFAERAGAARIGDTTVVDRYGAAVEAEMARLLALPGVAEAQAATEAHMAAALAGVDTEAAQVLTGLIARPLARRHNATAGPAGAAPARRQAEAATGKAAAKGGGLGHVLVSTMKNEGVYALEFVAHHRVLGFDGIYIASNDCTDGTDLLLDALAAGGAIHHARNEVPPGGAPSHLGYQLLRRSFGLDRADWLMAIDVDEFLHVSVPGGRVQDLTARAPGDVDVIALSALTFGTGDTGEGWTPERVCRRFTLRTPPRHSSNGPVKSLTRDPERFAQIHNHSMVGFRPEGPARAMRGSGAVFDLDPGLPEWRQLRQFRRADIGHDLAHYNHYSIKSPDEFVLRRARGRGVGSGEAVQVRHTDRYFAERAEAATVRDLRILRRYGAAVEAEMARLMALPGVAEAQAACEAHMAAAIAAAEG